MKELCCVICGKYRKCEKPKISHFLEKAFRSTICSKCKNEDEELLKEESIETLKIVVLIENI